MIDYTRGVFYEKKLKQLLDEKQFRGAKIAKFEHSKKECIKPTCFQCAVERLMSYQRFQRQKEGKIQELIRQLKRQNSGVIKNEARKTEKVIEEQTPIMKQKIQSLVIKQINQLQSSAENQQERLSNIGELIKEIQDGKEKKDGSSKSREKSGSKSKSKDKKRK